MAIKAITMNNFEIAILELHGTFVDKKETDALKEKATDLFEQGNRKLIIDLADARYVNSLGIGSLISVHTMYTRGNGQIKLCHVGKSIQNIFVLTKLISVLDVEETREEAINNFK